MRQVDLTENLQKQKGSRVCYQTIYTNSPYYGFPDSSSMSTGISFTRKSNKEKVKWYFGCSKTLSKAVATVRKRYNINLKVKGWDKIRVKAYNFSGAKEIITLLEEI